MSADLLDKLFLPTDETGDDERVHVWVGVILLFLILYVLVIYRGLGERAI